MRFVVPITCVVSIIAMVICDLMTPIPNVELLMLPALFIFAVWFIWDQLENSLVESY